MKQRLLELWNLLRTLASDDAYERYVDHCSQAHSRDALLTRQEFYKRQQETKWSGISRCC
ncbi:MAG TPA: YbdD/YjiX family protein [Steroidobacteraceae bacterium]|jgi:uncharacterized short protein YbdD (DUF466 family)